MQVKIKWLINHHSSELAFPCTPLENESHFVNICAPALLLWLLPERGCTEAPRNNGDAPPHLSNPFAINAFQPLCMRSSSSRNSLVTCAIYFCLFSSVFLSCGAFFRSSSLSLTSCSPQRCWFPQGLLLPAHRTCHSHGPKQPTSLSELPSVLLNLGDYPSIMRSKRKLPFNPSQAPRDYFPIAEQCIALHLLFSPG